MYSKGFPFTTVNDPYWFPMMDAVANFGSGFKPASMHELRTQILKEEMNDLSIIMEDHKKLGNNMDVQLCQMVRQMERVGVLSIFS